MLLLHLCMRTITSLILLWEKKHQEVLFLIGVWKVLLLVNNIPVHYSRVESLENNNLDNICYTLKLSSFQKVT